MCEHLGLDLPSFLRAIAALCCGAALSTSPAASQQWQHNISTKQVGGNSFISKQWPKHRAMFPETISLKLELNKLHKINSPVSNNRWKKHEESANETFWQTQRTFDALYATYANIKQTQMLFKFILRGQDPLFIQGLMRGFLKQTQQSRLTFIRLQQLDPCQVIRNHENCQSL